MDHSKGVTTTGIPKQESSSQKKKKKRKQRKVGKQQRIRTQRTTRKKDIYKEHFQGRMW